MKTETVMQSDLEALTELNRDYIHSVQHGDVQRFDEILAEDFLCSNPDGSLVDKKQFLAQNRSAGNDQWPLDAGGAGAHSRRCRDHPRTHQLHHGRWRTAKWPLYRCLGSPERKMACRISTCDAIAVFSHQGRISCPLPAGAVAASSPADALGCRWRRQRRISVFAKSPVARCAPPAAPGTSEPTYRASRVSLCRTSAASRPI